MSDKTITLRHELRPGDIGHVVQRHGLIYGALFGWDYTFEAYVARPLAEFALRRDGERERMWLAEMRGRIVGSIAIVSGEADAAQLRWFLVEPECRGMGVGGRLIDEALRFCRATGRRRVYLWTVAGLEAAAHLYTRAGFRLTTAQPQHRWGGDMIEQRYDLDL